MQLSRTRHQVLQSKSARKPFVLWRAGVPRPTEESLHLKAACSSVAGSRGGGGDESSLEAVCTDVRAVTLTAFTSAAF